MKRMLQLLGLLQLVLVIGLAVRVVSVLTTPLPEFGDIPELPAPRSLPPPKPMPKASETVTNAIVEHDLFDEQRGQGVTIDPGDVVVDAAPVPPPATVKLMGVIMLGPEPKAILLDTNLKPDQQSVSKGDMFGEYEIGEIAADHLMLLGGGGQQFQIPLRVEAAGAGGAPVVAAPHPAPPPGAGAARPATAARPVTPRPPNAHGANQPDQQQKAMSARERAQAIAQKNVEMRKANAQKNAPEGEGGGQNEANAPDPVQARLEALKQLREAAKRH